MIFTSITSKDIDSLKTILVIVTLLMCGVKYNKPIIAAIEFILITGIIFLFIGGWENNPQYYP